MAAADAGFADMARPAQASLLPLRADCLLTDAGTFDRAMGATALRYVLPGRDVRCLYVRPMGDGTFSAMVADLAPDSTGNHRFDPGTDPAPPTVRGLSAADLLDFATSVIHRGTAKTYADYAGR